MIESVSLCWMLIVALAGASLWFVFRGVRSGNGYVAAGPTDRVTNLAHAVMAAAMVAMIWPMG
jgi:hypothetical protein